MNLHLLSFVFIELEFIYFKLLNVNELNLHSLTCFALTST